MKATVDVERQNLTRKTSSQVVSASVLNETLTRYLESAGNSMKFVCEFSLHIVCGIQIW